MRTLNWPRILLCGFVAGVVFTLLTAVLVGAFGGAFFAAASANAAGGETKTGLWLYLTTIAGGVWAMWLYAVVRPWLLTRWGAALVASLAWWLIASLQSLKWVLLLGMPVGAWMPLAGNIIPTVLAVLVGTVLFGDVQPKQSFHPTSSVAEPLLPG